MPATLTGRAAILRETGIKTVLETIPVRKQPSELLPGECIVKLEYSGVCHSDLHFMLGEFAPPELPCIGGHEGVGHIVAIGEHTVGSRFGVGDRVGVTLYLQTCMACEFCRSGKEQYCLNFKLLGIGEWGTFSEYVVAHVDYLASIPDTMPSAVAAPILCAGVTVYSALKNGQSNVGEWIAISGAGGGLGHLAIQYALAMGLRVIAIDTGEQKKNVCIALGAEKWIDFKESSDVVADVRSAADGVGPHVALIATGTNLPYVQASLYLRPTGRLLCVGLPSSPVNGLLLTSIAVRGIKLIGSTFGNRQEMVEALALVARGKIKPHFEVIPHDKINTVLEQMHMGELVGRVVLKY
ncbi:mannitol-1-phosphate dehydrogenase [Obba rivulosa]|uniref:alcohol dehydrogenase n=1 Tax=Obba rivulosa TaxID=1052685 RepID=A0A8E2ANL6_9APHY|nr:mannitol-1-phosphate dehydrogenase [Obba rivulosa]